MWWYTLPGWALDGSVVDTIDDVMGSLKRLQNILILPNTRTFCCRESLNKLDPYPNFVLFYGIISKFTSYKVQTTAPNLCDQYLYSTLKMPSTDFAMPRIIMTSPMLA
jgi:hypothetical protein